MYKNIVQIPSFLHVYTSERTEQNAPQRNLSCAFKSWKQRSTGKTVSFRTATAVPYVQKKNTNTHTYTRTQIEHTHTHTHTYTHTHTHHGSSLSPFRILNPDTVTVVMSSPASHRLSLFPCVARLAFVAC